MGTLLIYSLTWLEEMRITGININKSEFKNIRVN